MPSPTSDAVLDFHGRVMFHCGACGAPVGKDDFFELGLRLPDADESKDDYCESELVDSVSHPACLRASGALAG
ncbi:MAG TPA: hypothetical protein VEZ14_06565 [Dehalococcoidia bacterium]|nr:hypothetical protein [Dehalococcoidia bacterium]